MRKLYLAILLLAVAAATVGTFASGAEAGTKVLAGTFTPSQIEKACSNAGGVPTNNDATGGYGCYAKGGEVECTKGGKCTGRCASCGGPAIAHGGKGTVLGVLSGNTLKTNTPTKTTDKPIHINQPIANSKGTANTERQGKKK